MKKLLVVLLALVMVFGFATTALAVSYSDIGDLSVKSQDSINKLTALEIIGGYEDGTYAPTATITRAEFCKIAVNIAGLGDAAGTLVDTASVFSDVKTGAWYTGWINMAYSQGFVKGYTDGSFMPNAEITMAEVITVLLRIDGFDDNLPGAWPFDYIAQASKLDVLDNVTFVSNNNATREQVACMTDANLDVEMVYWDADKAAFIGLYGLTNNTQYGVGNYETLLAHNFSVAIIEDALIDFGTTVAFNPYDGFSIAEFTDRSYELNYSLINAAGTAYIPATAEIADNVVISGGYDLADLAGNFTDLIINDDDEVVYVEVTSSIVAYTDNLVAFTTKLKVDNKTYSYSAVESGDTLAAAITNANNNYTLKNYVYLTDKSVAYLAFADGDIIAPDSIMMVDSVTEASGRVDALDGAPITGLKDKDNDVIFIKNGVEVAFTELAQYDVVSEYTTSISGDRDHFYVVQTLSEGTMSKVYGTTHATVEGKKYPIDAAAILLENKDVILAADLADYVGEAVKYLVNPQGKLIAIVSGSAANSTWYYGVMTDYTYAFDKTGAAIDTDLKTIEILTAEGKQVTYDTKGDGATSAVVRTAPVVTPTGGVIAGTATVVVANGDLIKYRLNSDGKVSEVVAADVAYGAAVAIDGDATRERINLTARTLFVPSGVAAFDVDMTDLDDSKLISAAELLAADSTSVISYFFSGSDLKAIAIQGFSSAASYGIIKDFGYSTAAYDPAITLYDLDPAEYELSGAAPVAKKDIYTYTLSGTDLTLTSRIYANKAYVFTSIPAGLTAVEYAEVTSVKNGVVAVGVPATTAAAPTPRATTQLNGISSFTLENNTTIIDMDTFKYASGVYKGDLIMALINTDNEAELVIIFDL